MRCVVIALVGACGGAGGGSSDDTVGDDDPMPLPPPSCAPAATGSTTVGAPTLAYTLADRYQEAWLASPAVADLDGCLLYTSDAADE